MRLTILPPFLLAVLAGCAQTVPNQTVPVFFDPVREAALENGTTLPAPATVTEEPLDGTQPSIELQDALRGGGQAPVAPTTGDGDVDALAAETAAVLSGGAGAATAPVTAGRITAVDSTQRVPAQTTPQPVIAPAPLPQRDPGAAPNIVAYALATSHPPGTRVYSRTSVNPLQNAQRACARYPSPDQAQIDFLASGGPDRDRKGLDPDGDGYACNWDPQPFRSAVQN